PAPRRRWRRQRSAPPWSPSLRANRFRQATAGSTEDLLQILAGGRQGRVICRELLATLQRLALESFADNCKRARRLQSELPGNHLSDSNQWGLTLIDAFSSY